MTKLTTVIDTLTAMLTAETDRCNDDVDSSEAAKATYSAERIAYYRGALWNLDQIENSLKQQQEDEDD